MTQPVIRYAVARQENGVFIEYVARDQSMEQATRLAAHWNDTLTISQRWERWQYIVVIDTRDER